MTDLEGRSPGSTIAMSEMMEDTHNLTAPSSPMRADPRTSLQHVLGATESRHNTPASVSKQNDMTEDEGTRTPSGAASKAPSKRSKASNQNSSIYVGNKVRHLKKDDSEPLWRKDIQYDFLKAVFEDDRAVFTNSYEAEGYHKQTFANLYIDTMARSSKTSKILRDKLLSDHEPAKNMAMVCLLVNLGRMNTTLNFFPEMRAQLRTYHPIPSLQAHQDPNSYKQLQDAPRLKSILKGATEDRPEPSSIEKIKQKPSAPRTNPVNLIFVLSQFSAKVTELHFPPPRDFYDLIMRPQLSSRSRARAFLWLMWHYLESDFTEQGAEENPFGAGVDYKQEVANQGVPELEELNDEETELENVDTPEEVEYGTAKARERKRIIEADQAAFSDQYGPPKRGPKSKMNLLPEEGQGPASIIPRMRTSKYDSDLDSTRSTPPPKALIASGMRIGSVLNNSAPGSRKGASLRTVVDLASSPAPSGPGAAPVIVNESPAVVARRQRPLTAHQLAVEANRTQRVEYILSRGIRKAHHTSRKLRKRDGAFYRALKRSQQCADPSEDSEGEESKVKLAPPFRERGFVGLVQLESETDDYGEEMASYAAAVRRMGRRLDRWEDHKGPVLGVVGTRRISQIKKGAVNGHGRSGGDDTDDGGRHSGNNGDGELADEDDLDDMDKELLGLASEDEAEEDLDDVEKVLLGMRDDETEDEGGMDID